MVDATPTVVTRYIPPCELGYPPTDDTCSLRGTEYWRGLDVCPRCRGIAVVSIEVLAPERGRWAAQ